MEEVVQKDPFEKYIPNTFDKAPESAGPVHIYIHKPTGCPIAIILGGSKGIIIGGIIYFREQNDSMNMEMEVTMDMMEFTIKFVEKMFFQTIARDNMDGLRTRFFDNLEKTLENKNGFTLDGTTARLGPLKRPKHNKVEETKEKIKNEEKEKIEEKQKIKEKEKEKIENEEKEEECMICLDNPADTTVMPCFHTVVCSDCSHQLENTADAKICCQCRRPIEGVFYPDNTMKEIK